MKHWIIILVLQVFLSKASSGQDSKDLFFDEFQVSLNRTHLQDDNTVDRFGFGLGAYRSFMSDKRMNLVFGLEYNRTSQFKKSMYEGHFTQATDLTYNINCISIPIGFRVNVGAKLKVFFEAGGFADLIINSNRTGTKHTYSPDSNNQLHYNRTEIDEKVTLSNTLGLYTGCGIRIPVSRFELIVKTDYKFGINKLDSYYDHILNRYFRINIGLKIN